MVIPVSKPNVTSDETKYRQELFPDVKEILKVKHLVCTSCSSSLKDPVAKGKPISHPFLETLLCQKCYLFYGDGEFSLDEDGSDKYCRWCGQGGTLFLCSKCTAGFCKRCVKRNLPRNALNELEDDDWVCYCCNTKPLYELRAHCWAAQQYADDLKANDKKSVGKKRSRGSSIDEEDEIKSKSKKKKNKKSSSDEVTYNVENHRRNKRRHRHESRKSDRKRDRKNGNVEKKEDKVNVQIDNEQLPTVSSIITSDYKKKLNDFITDFALITKECHKQILIFKTKKTNIDTVKDVKNLHSSIKEVINSYFTAGEEVLRVFDENTEAFVNEIDGGNDNKTEVFINEIDGGNDNKTEVFINEIDGGNDNEPKVFVNKIDCGNDNKTEAFVNKIDSENDNETTKLNADPLENKDENVIKNNGDVLESEPKTAEKVTKNDETLKLMETNENEIHVKNEVLDSEKTIESGSTDTSKIDKELEDGLDKNPDNPATKTDVALSESTNGESLDVSTSKSPSKSQNESSKS